MELTSEDYAQFFQSEYDANWYTWWNDFKDNDPRYWSKGMAKIFDEWRFPRQHLGGYTKPVPLDEYIWPTEKERDDWYKKVMGTEAPRGPSWMLPVDYELSAFKPDKTLDITDL